MAIRIDPPPAGDGASTEATPTVVPTAAATEAGLRVPTPTRPAPSAATTPEAGVAEEKPALEVQDLNVYYGTFRAINNISLAVKRHQVTAIIGPSGCGKSTFLRTLNRMHELTPNAHVDGKVVLDGIDINGPDVDPVQLRRIVGMVFQRPNPFPMMTIYDNVVAGVKLTGRRSKADLDEVAERSLRRAALWDEVKDKLKANGMSLSGGQQQRLCIARALAVDPEVILMDEPASALDPVATLRIEQLMSELRENYTIVIVTHNMQQAARVSDATAFFTMGDDRAGYLVEMGRTTDIFTNPKHQLTEDYVSGRFG